MGPRIALLLSGEPADLSASICAVQLAARSDSKLYALQDCLEDVHTNGAAPAAVPRPMASRFAGSFSFVVEFAGTEGVRVSCHQLNNRTIEQMLDFLIAHAITCLVVNKSYGEDEERSARITDLQKRHTAAPRRFHSHLQVITAPPLEEMDIKQVIRQLRHLKPFTTQNN